MVFAVMLKVHTLNCKNKLPDNKGRPWRGPDSAALSSSYFSGSNRGWRITPEGNLTSNIKILLLFSLLGNDIRNPSTYLGHCYILACYALLITVYNCALCGCLSNGFFYTIKTHFPLNLSLCPTDQLRDSHVLPVQNVSIQELQAQLEQETRLHQEEQEKFTERIIQVNTKPIQWGRHLTTACRIQFCLAKKGKCIYMLLFTPKGLIFFYLKKI